MLDFLKRLFGISAKPVEASTPLQTAPYKVPEPASTTIIPLVVKIPTTIVEKAPVKSKAKAPAKPKVSAAPKVKAPAKPKAPRASKTQS